MTHRLTIRRALMLGSFSALLAAGCAAQQTAQDDLEQQLIAAEAERARMQAQLDQMQRNESSARPAPAAVPPQITSQPVAPAPTRQQPVPYTPPRPPQPVVAPAPQPTFNQAAMGQRATAEEMRGAPMGSLEQSPVPPGMSSGDLPPNPRPGECYARLYYPPQYENRVERVLKSEASERVDIIPAEYELVDERVLVKAAYEKVVQVLPPEYRTIKEDVVVSPGYEKIEKVPAKYNNVEEKILVRPAYTMWKQGRGPVEKFDQATGEIMCLVEVPAEYKTVTKRVLVSPETTRRVQVPPQLEQVEKRVLVKPSQVIKETVPAEYKVVKVRKIKTPSQERRTPVPAEYQMVEKKVKVTEGRTVWRAVLCETNMSNTTVEAIQQALAARGFSPGSIDGVIGEDTLRAAAAFQRQQGLPQGQLSMETLRALGVRL